MRYYIIKCFHRSNLARLLNIGDYAPRQRTFILLFLVVFTICLYSRDRVYAFEFSKDFTSKDSGGISEFFSFFSFPRDNAIEKGGEQNREKDEAEFFQYIHFFIVPLCCLWLIFSQRRVERFAIGLASLLAKSEGECARTILFDRANQRAVGLIGRVRKRNSPFGRAQRGRTCPSPAGMERRGISVRVKGACYVSFFIMVSQLFKNSVKFLQSLSCPL